MGGEFLILPLGVLMLVVIFQAIALLHSQSLVRKGWKREEGYQKIIDDLNGAFATLKAAYEGKSALAQAQKDGDRDA